MNHNSSLFQKPENALKRANELIKIGSSEGALTLLHEVLSQRKIRTWQKSYETIMIRYIDLCVELKDHNRGKDGLHQFRNLSQTQAPGSLEVVITHYLDSAEAKLSLAADSAEAAVVEAERVADLENAGTPESIMMSTMTEEGERQRGERKLLLPWLIFVWETYRSVLDILRSNSKLEVVYHNTAARAFDFCSRFKRKVEFRRLCEMLRSHLGSLAKAGLGPAPVTDKRLRGWDGWSDESIEMHLNTRFKQLEVTTKLELWTEGFRTVEDIHAIMHINPKKPPKSRVMANYYEKLIKIFWVSENYLFHAYAWFKYYTLCDSFNTKMTAEERTEMATNVVLAAMAIPDLKGSAGNSAMEGSGFGEDGGAGNKAVGGERPKEVDELVSATLLKNRHMAALLGFHSEPSRQALLVDLHHRSIFKLARPEVSALHENLELKFHPLDLVQACEPGLQCCKGSSTLASYVAPLTKLLVLRLLKQLAAVYNTVTVAHFLGLVKDLGFTHDEVEKLIVAAVKDKVVAVRLDHSNEGLLRFGGVGKGAGRGGSGGAAMESEGMRGQLTTLAHQLQKVVGILNPTQALADSAAKSGERASFFASVRENLEKEHLATLNRKNIIERRKEEAERREKEKEKFEELKRTEDEKVRKQQEKERVQKEAKDRDLKKRQQMAKEMELIEKKKLLEGAGVQVTNIKEMSDKDILNLQTKAEADAEARRLEAIQKKTDQAKRLDYIVRAVRDSEVTRHAALRSASLETSQALFEALSTERQAESLKAFEEDCAAQAELAKMSPFCKEFEAPILVSRKREHEKGLKVRRQEAYNRKIARARKLKEDKEEEAFEAEQEQVRKQEEAQEAQQRAAEKKEQDELAAKAKAERDLEEANARRERDAAAAAADEKRLKMLEEARLIRATREGDGGGGEGEAAPPPAAATEGARIGGGGGLSSLAEKDGGGGWRGGGGGSSGVGFAFGGGGRSATGGAPSAGGDARGDARAGGGGSEAGGGGGRWQRGNGDDQGGQGGAPAPQQRRSGFGGGRSLADMEGGGNAPQGGDARGGDARGGGLRGMGGERNSSGGGGAGAGERPSASGGADNGRWR